MPYSKVSSLSNPPTGSVQELAGCHSTACFVGCYASLAICSRLTTEPALGNSTYAGALAAIMANVVLIAYIVVAMAEDQSESQDGKKEGKKDR